MNQKQEGSLTRKILTLIAQLAVITLITLSIYDTYQNPFVEFVGIGIFLLIFFIGLADIQKVVDAKLEELKEDELERKQLIEQHKQLSAELKEIKEKLRWKKFMGNVLDNQDETPNTKKE